MSVRVRFAPSPTGPLHIGGLRTALFNYLFAKKNHGTFILRIEDTDQNRYSRGAEDYICEALAWCNIRYEEGPSQGGPHTPYRQSDRKAIYRQYADQLLQAGYAYIAFDTPEEIDRLRKEAESQGQTFQYDLSVRDKLNNSLALGEAETKKRIASGIPYVIRFKVPAGTEIQTTDLIRGQVSFQSSVLDDKVLFKPDGLPTYHLANVVDDYLMKITHVIRGEEWLPSLPLHILLYKAFGWESVIPQFAHLPLILKPSGQGKLSKRDGDKLGFPVYPLQWTDPDTGEVSSGYRESGYLPEAVVNIIAFLGWNPGTEQEIFTLEEMAAVFSLDRVGKSGARFDPEKAKWYNQQYLKKKSGRELTEDFISILRKKVQNNECYIDHQRIEKIVNLVRERIVFTNDLWDQSVFFFQAPVSYDPVTVKKAWKEDTPGLMLEIRESLNSIAAFTAEEIEQTIKLFSEMKQVGLGKIFNPLRLLIVGGSFGPHLPEIMAIIGKPEALARIDRGLETLGK